MHAFFSSILTIVLYLIISNRKADTQEEPKPKVVLFLFHVKPQKMVVVYDP